MQHGFVCACATQKEEKAVCCQCFAKGCARIQRRHLLFEVWNCLILLLLLLLLLLVLLLLLWFPFKLLRLLPAVLRRTGAVRVYSCHVHSASSTRCFHLGLQVLGMYFQLFKLLQRACEFLVHIQGDGGLKFELHLCQELCNILRPVDQHLARFSDLLPLGIQLILWQGKFVDA